MKTYNTQMTLEEAVRLNNMPNASFPDTLHNRAIVAQALDMFLLTLRK